MICLGKQLKKMKRNVSIEVWTVWSKPCRGNLKRKENSKTAYLKPASGNFRTRTWAQLHSNVYLISYYRPEPPGEGARPPLWLGINKDLLSPCTNSDPQFVTTKSSLSGLPEVLVAAVALTEHFLFSWLLPSKYFLNLKLMQTSVARQGKSDLKR